MSLIQNQKVAPFAHPGFIHVLISASELLRNRASEVHHLGPSGEYLEFSYEMGQIWVLELECVSLGGFLV